MTIQSHYYRKKYKCFIAFCAVGYLAEKVAYLLCVCGVLSVFALICQFEKVQRREVEYAARRRVNTGLGLFC